MAGFLDRLFPPPRRVERTRPDDLLYGVEDRPPLPLTLAIAGQHAFLALMFTVYAVVVAETVGFKPAAAIAYVSASILLMGIATLLQSLRSRFGAGMLLIAIPAAGRMPAFLAIAVQYGLGAAMGSVLVAGSAAVILARFLPRLRPLFPPEVIGVVVFMLGMMLVSAGLSRSFGFTSSGGLPDGGFSGGDLATAAATLASLVVISVAAPPAIRRLAIIIGTVVGAVVAVMTGVFRPDSAAVLLDMPLFALPVIGLDIPRPEFLLGPIVMMLFSQLAGVMDQFASALSMDKMSDAHWRRADMPMVARSVTGLGLMHLLHGVVGVLPVATSSANIGFALASGVTARVVGMAAGVILIAAAFVPPLAGLIVLVPAPVIGGVLVYTASYMIVAGTELMTSRMMNNRRSTVVGLSIVCGVGVMILPALGDIGPEWTRIILHSGLTVGLIAAVVLNAVLRIGVRQKVSLTLDPMREAAEAAEFLAKNGQAWGARQEVVVRAGIVVGEALEALRNAEIAGPVKLTASFDEFSLRCRLRYTGKVLILEKATAIDASLLDEDDDAIDAAMRRVSGVLISRLADRVRVVQHADRADLILTFEH